MPPPTCLTRTYPPSLLLQIQFTVVLGSSAELFRPQQAFVRVAAPGSEVAAYFAATKLKDGSMSAEFKPMAVQKLIGVHRGHLELSIIVGDSRVANAIHWAVADVELTYPPLADGSQPPEAGELKTIDALFRCVRCLRCGLWSACVWGVVGGCWG